MSTTRVLVSAATDIGLKRSHNEDFFGTWKADDAAEHDRFGTLLVIADGMGGSSAGEVASRLAVETVLRAYRASPDKAPLESLRGALAEANRVVHENSRTHPELRGMGTTCTALAVVQGRTLVAHVGDSRAYALRGGAIRQITRDHSLVAQLVENRQITPEQARVDPRRNLVTRSVGVAPEVEIDAHVVDELLRDGDTLLLCTDGLHGLVHDDELAASASGPDLERACDALVRLARERGGPDNITLILARIQTGA
jgi:protein phosphatase